jgi:hypothetical protein
MIYWRLIYIGNDRMTIFDGEKSIIIRYWDNIEFYTLNAYNEVLNNYGPLFQDNNPTALAWWQVTSDGIVWEWTLADPIRSDISWLPSAVAPDPNTAIVMIRTALWENQQMFLADFFTIVPNNLIWQGNIDASTDPAFPSPSETWWLRFITVPWTVWGIEVEAWDQLIDWDSGFFVIQANSPILLATNTSFIASATGSLLSKNRIYAIIGAWFIEPAYMLSTGTNTYINLWNSWVAELDNTGVTSPDITDISLAKRIRLKTTWVSENLGNVIGNIVGYGNTFEQIQNAPVLISSEAWPSFNVVYPIPLTANKVKVTSWSYVWYQDLNVWPKTYIVDNWEISIDTTPTTVTVTDVSWTPTLDALDYFTMYTNHSWLENHGTGMTMGVPFAFYNKSYDWRVAMNVYVYASSVQLTPGVDFTVITSWPLSGINPLVSYPADFIQVEYEYIPNTALIYSLTSVFDAVSIPAPDAIVWDFGKQRKLLSYSTNTGENDYIEIVRWPSYNSVKNVRIITDVVTDPWYRVGDVTFQVAATYDEFEAEQSNWRIVDGRKYILYNNTSIDYTQITWLSSSWYRHDTDLNWIPSWLSVLDTSVYVTNWILDITKAKYAGTIVLTCPDPTIKWFTIQWWIQGKIYRFKFEWSYWLHVFWADKADTIAWSIILLEEPYRYILADTYRTESLTLEYSTAWYYQEIGSISDRNSLTKKSKIYDSDFLVATTDEFKVLSASIWTNAIVNSWAGEFGVLRSQTWASALWRAWWNGQTGVAMCVNDSLPLVFKSSIRITTLADWTQSFFTKSWFFDLVANHVNSMIIRHDPTTGNWIIMTSVAWPLATVIDTWIPVSAWVKYNLMVIATSTEVMFMIWQAGGSYNYAWSIATNIPTTNFVYWQIIQKTLWSTARDMFTDYWAVYKYLNR